MARVSGSAASLALGLALAGVAFGAKSGLELTRLTTTELALLGVGGLVLAIAVVYARRGPVYGGASLLLLAAFCGLTVLSIGWSVAPELSWIEANRSIAYLAVLAAGLGAARLAPTASPVLLRGLLLAAAAIVAYSLASRVWPAALAEEEAFARIREPYGYWNAVGITAALAIPPALWLGARRSGRRHASALAFPLCGLLLVALVLSASRGALVAALVAVAIWLVAVPLRLRSLSVLLVGSAGAAPVVVWALSKDAFTENRLPLATRESVGTELGLLLVLMCLALLVAGMILGFDHQRVLRSPRLRRRLGAVAVAVACVAPMLAFTSAASSDRGLTGTVTDRIDQLTSESATTPGDATRLTRTSSSRSVYWREAGEIFERRPELGTGAGTFGIARLRHRSEGASESSNAHGFVAQSLSDLGLAGLGLSLALGLAWLLAAARTTGIPPRLRRRSPGAPVREWTDERIALTALALSALTFGLQSATDWTWYVPGPTVMALLAAGFVAGRGPEFRPVAGGSGALAAESTAVLPPVGERSRRRRLARALAPRPDRRVTRLLLAAGVLVAVALCAWSVSLPERADRASSRALALIEAGDLDGASEEARSAADMNPLSLEPLYVEAAVEDAAGRESSSRSLLERAVLEHPSDPEPWLRLATYQLEALDRPVAALETLRGVLYLDPKSFEAARIFREARAEVAARQEARERQIQEIIRRAIEGAERRGRERRAAEAALAAPATTASP